MTMLRRRSRYDPYYKYLVYGLFAPIVVYQGNEILPEYLKVLSKGHRMFNSINCVEQKIATEFDALIYLHTASLAVPFSTDWFEIYVHLFRKFFSKHADIIDLPRVELDNYKEHLLRDLRSWIYKQQAKHLKNKFGVNLLR